MAPAKSRTRLNGMRIFTVVAVILIVAGFAWRIVAAVTDTDLVASPGPTSTSNTVEEGDNVDGEVVDGAINATQSCELVMSTREFEDFNERLLKFGEIRMMADSEEKFEQLRTFVTQDYFDFYVPPTADDESNLGIRNVFDSEATQTECFMESESATVLATSMVPAVTTYGIVDGVEAVLEEPSTDISYDFVWVKLDGVWYVNQES